MTVCSDPRWCRFGHGTRWRLCDRQMKLWHTWRYQCGQARPIKENRKPRLITGTVQLRGQRPWMHQEMAACVLGWALGAASRKPSFCSCRLFLPCPTGGQGATWKLWRLQSLFLYYFFPGLGPVSWKGEWYYNPAWFLPTISMWRCTDYGPRIQNFSFKSILPCHQFLLSSL